MDRPREERTGPTFDAVSDYVHELRGQKSPTDTTKEGSIPMEQRKRLRRQKWQAKQQGRLEKAIAKCTFCVDFFIDKPGEDSKIAHTDPNRTLFVGRLAYATTEATLQDIFKYYGSIKGIRLINGDKGKSRGYAFIEFSSERSLEKAYRECDAMKIDGRRIVVDVERGRTVQGWLPRRLGGGLGRTRASKRSQVSATGREDAPLPAKRAKYSPPTDSNRHLGAGEPPARTAKPRPEDVEPGEVIEDESTAPAPYARRRSSHDTDEAMHDYRPRHQRNDYY